jgi:hypothetical protein
MTFISKHNGIFRRQKQNGIRRCGMPKTPFLTLDNKNAPRKNSSLGVRHEIPVGKYDQWARTSIGTVRGRDHRSLDEFGNLVVQRNRYPVDWRFTSTFLSVVEYCLVVSPNEDGSVPQVRAAEIWSRCYEGGKTTVPFCERKWAVCRDWLEGQGIINVVDRDWQRGKAMRWAVGEDFSRLPEWWRRKREPSPMEAVPLEEFLLDNNREPTHVLNTYTVLAVLDLTAVPDSGAIPIRSPPSSVC